MCNHHWCPFRALHEIQAQLARIERNQERIMASQDDINQAIATDTALVQDLTAQVSAVQAAQAAFEQEIANLQAQGVDTSGLVAASQQLAAAQAPLDSAVSALSAASNPPAPPAA